MTEHKRMGAIVDPHSFYASTFGTLAKKSKFPFLLANAHQSNGIFYRF